MADKPRLKLQVIGKRVGATANPDQDRFPIERNDYPDLIEALRAYFEANPDVRHVKAIAIERRG